MNTRALAPRPVDNPSFDISYIDRNTLALLAPTILRDTHLTNQQYGFIISAYSIA